MVPIFMGKWWSTVRLSRLIKIWQRVKSWTSTMTPQRSVTKKCQEIHRPSYDFTYSLYEWTLNWLALKRAQPQVTQVCEIFPCQLQKFVDAKYKKIAERKNKERTQFQFVDWSPLLVDWIPSHSGPVPSGPFFLVVCVRIKAEKKKEQAHSSGILLEHLPSMTHLWKERKRRKEEVPLGLGWLRGAMGSSRAASKIKWQA